MPGQPTGQGQGRRPLDDRREVTDLRSRVARRRVLVGAVLVVAVVAAVVVIVDPFGGGASPSSAGLDNGAPTSTALVTRQDLSSQTQVSATLGYGDTSVVSVPAGTAPSTVQQQQQQSASAQSALQAAQATLAADNAALVLVQATLAADRRKLAVDCGGDNAAETGGGGGSGTSAAPCATGYQAVAADEQSMTADTAKVQADRRAVSSSQTALSGADEVLSAAQSSAAIYGQTSVYTTLPTVGRVIRLGETLFAIGGQPVVLLYGLATPWRAFAPGMSPGGDVWSLNENLRALGYGQPEGSAFTAETAAAIKAFQAAHGLPVTGRLLLGSVVFEPGPIRVTVVTPSLGAPVQAGPVLDVTSTRRVVTIALDASQQTSVKVGDPVTITLPDTSTTPGRVTFVGTVATAASDQGNGPSTPTIEVDVTPDDPNATGRLDQAPVDVSITTATVKGVLVVPVNALLALAGGGYAVEEVEPGGAHRLVAVEPSLFDDSKGLVQVSGSGLFAGRRIVVPAS
jgi:peptidoglycan hydrolase-like protein with peptidoglycan-binding domain